MSNWSTSNSIYGSSYNTLMGMRNNTYQQNGLSHRTSPKGLDNLTNTCYISAVLQILFQIIKQGDFPIKQKSQQQITYLFFKLKQTMDRDDYKRFKVALEDRVEIVKGWDQQDAHELLIQLIDQFRKQNSDKLTPGKPNLAFNEAKQFQSNWKNFIKEMEKIQKGKIISLFYGEIIKQYTCPNGHRKHNFERYSNLSLPFSPKSSSSRYYYSEGALKLSDMMEQFLGEQTIEDLICEKCEKKRTFKKASNLYTIPKYLILHLSRFMKGYYDNEKNTRQVSFDEVINMDQQGTKKTVRYQLLGVIHHIGSLNRGHYYANVKINNEWYEFDDEKVSSASIYSSRNQSKSVYLLVYQRS